MGNENSFRRRFVTDMAAQVLTTIIMRPKDHVAEENAIKRKRRLIIAELTNQFRI